MRYLQLTLFLLFLLSCGATNPQPSRISETNAQVLVVVAPTVEGRLAIYNLAGLEVQVLASRVNSAPCIANPNIFYTQVQSATTQLIRLNVTSNMTNVLVDDPTAKLDQIACSTQTEELLYTRLPVELVHDEPSLPNIWQVKSPTPSEFYPEHALNQQWSPDGRWLVFELADEPYLMLRNPQGAFHKLDYTGTFAWSPDSQALVVSQLKDLDTGRFERLVRYDVTSQQTTTIFSDPMADVYYPRWSPDGKQIAFVRRPLGAETGEIWVLPVANPETARQISNDSQYDNFDPQWSADNQRLLWGRVLLQESRFSVWQQGLAETQPSLVADDALWGRWFNRQ